MKLDAPIAVILQRKGSKVWSIASDATVYEALLLMADKQIGALLVTDGPELVGIFSERDYARRVVIAGRSSKEMTVREVMSSPVITVEPTSTVSACMEHMTGKRCRHLPVVDGERVAGMVSLGDLVNWIISTQERTIRELEDFISGDYPG